MLSVTIKKIFFLIRYKYVINLFFIVVLVYKIMYIYKIQSNMY